MYASGLVAMALAAATVGSGGHLTIVGAVVTPTAASVPFVVHGRRLTAGSVERFAGPPRVISIQAPRQPSDMTQVVVTYL